jgi:hypothetical protein
LTAASAVPVVKNDQENPTGGKQKLFCEYDSFGPVPKLTERNFRIHDVSESFDLAEQWAIQAGGQKECDNQGDQSSTVYCVIYVGFKVSRLTQILSRHPRRVGKPALPFSSRSLGSLWLNFF